MSDGKVRPQHAGGIKGIKNRPRALSFPSDTPANQAWVYGLGLPFQISPTEAGIFANIGRKDLFSQGKIDVEAGTDLIIFDDLDRIGAARVIPLQRGEEITHPRSDERLLMSSYPVAGGFVPWGAKRADGSPHPHAGTGFGLNCEWAYPVDRQGGPEQLADRIERYRLQQYRHDGNNFRVMSSDAIEAHQPLSCAVPDGDDLLMVLMTRSEEDVFVKQHGEAGLDRWRIEPNKNLPRPLLQFSHLVGVARWRFDADTGWHVSEYRPIPAAVNMGEASLIRDRDGSLLVTARPFVSSVYDIFVWRSRDQGASWQEVIHVENVRRAPVSINRSLGGTPYVAGNALHTLSGQKREYREALHLWPLAPDRRSLLSPMVIRDSLVEWGRTSAGRIRQVDHPSGRTVRLKDGNWRHILAYRVSGKGEVHTGIDPAATPIPGLYVDEVLSVGEPAPEWKF